MVLDTSTDAPARKSAPNGKGGGFVLQRRPFLSKHSSLDHERFDLTRSGEYPGCANVNHHSSGGGIQEGASPDVELDSQLQRLAQRLMQVGGSHKPAGNHRPFSPFSTPRGHRQARSLFSPVPSPRDLHPINFFLSSSSSDASAEGAATPDTPPHIVRPSGARRAPGAGTALQRFPTPNFLSSLSAPSAPGAGPTGELCPGSGRSASDAGLSCLPIAGAGPPLAGQPRNPILAELQRLERLETRRSSQHLKEQQHQLVGFTSEALERGDSLPATSSPPAAAPVTAGPRRSSSGNPILQELQRLEEKESAAAARQSAGSDLQAESGSGPSGGGAGQEVGCPSSRSHRGLPGGFFDRDRRVYPRASRLGVCHGGYAGLGLQDLERLKERDGSSGRKACEGSSEDGEGDAREGNSHQADSVGILRARPIEAKGRRLGLPLSISVSSPVLEASNADLFDVEGHSPAVPRKMKLMPRHVLDNLRQCSTPSQGWEVQWTRSITEPRQASPVAGTEKTGVAGEQSTAAPPASSLGGGKPTATPPPIRERGTQFGEKPPQWVPLGVAQLLRRTKTGVTCDRAPAPLGVRGRRFLGQVGSNKLDGVSSPRGEQLGPGQACRIRLVCQRTAAGLLGETQQAHSVAVHQASDAESGSSSEGGSTVWADSTQG